MGSSGWAHEEAGYVAGGRRRASEWLARFDPMDLTESISIEAPASDVFDAWVQLERAHEYADPVIERRRLAGGPLGVGAAYQAVDRWPGGEVTFTVRISAFQRPVRVAATCSDPIGGGWDAIFIETDGITELTFAWTLQPTGLRGLVLPPLKPLVRREARRFLAGFREWVESGRARSV